MQLSCQVWPLGTVICLATSLPPNSICFYRCQAREAVKASKTGGDRCTPFGFWDHPKKPPSVEVLQSSQSISQSMERKVQAGGLKPGMSSLFDLKPLLPSEQQTATSALFHRKGPPGIRPWVLDFLQPFVGDINPSHPVNCSGFDIADNSACCRWFNCLV